MTEETKWGSAFDAVDQDEQRRLRASAVAAQQHQPDTYARAADLAKRNEWPVDVVAGNLEEFEQQDRLKRLDALHAEAPGTASFASDPSRMALVQDDLTTASFLEASIRGLIPHKPTADFLSAPFRGLGRSRGGESAKAGTLAGVGATAQMAGEWLDRLNPLRGLRGKLHVVGKDGVERPDVAESIVDPLGFNKLATEGAAIAADSRAELNYSGNKVGGLPSSADWLTNPAGALEQATAHLANQGAASAPLMAVGVATRNPTLGAFALGVPTGAQTYSDLRSEGVDMGTATLAGLGTGAMEFAGEKLGLEALLKKPWRKALAVGPATEYAQEFVTQLGQETLENAATGTELDPATMLEHAHDAGLTGLFIGGAVAAGRAAVNAPLEYRDRRRAGEIASKLGTLHDSAVGAAKLDQLTELAAQFKLGERSPEDAEAFVEHVGGKDQHVYIPAGEFRTLFQQGGADEMATQLTGQERALALAGEHGDLVIPLAKYVAVVARLPNAAELAKVARLDADGYSRKDLEGLDLDAEVAAITGTTEEQGADDEHAKGVEEIKNGLTAALMATGRYKDADAELQAALASRMFGVMAKRSGQDVRALWDRYALRVNDQQVMRRADAPPASQGTGTAPKAPKKPKARTTPPKLDLPKVNPKTKKPHDMLRMIAAHGGLNRAAFGAQGVDPAHFTDRAGFHFLFRKEGGMSPGDLRAWMQQEGYLARDPEDGVATVDDNDALDLFDRAFRGGEKIYAEDQAQAVAEYRAAREAADNEFQDEVRADPAFADADFDPFAEDSISAEFAEQIADLTERAYALGATDEQIVGAAFDSSVPGQRIAALQDILEELTRERAQAADGGADASDTAGSAESSEEAGGRVFDQAVDGEAFRAWFDGSEVVDEDGEPLVVYHGTGSEFDTFRDNAGQATGHSTSPLGFFFTPNPELAEGYARNASDGVPADERVIAAYLAIRRPFELSLADAQEIAEPGEALALRAWLEDMGFDGIHIAGSDTWIAFASNQVKATDNRGTFNAESGNIYHQADGGSRDALRKWFGESQVVDEDGNPREVYHGTAFTFEEFAGYEITGWFSEDPEHTERHAEKAADEEVDEDHEPPAARTIPVYLSVQNPVRIDGVDMNDELDPESLENALRETGLEITPELRKLIASGEGDPVWLTVNRDVFAEEAAAQGFDGIRVLEDGSVTWAIFKSNQAKSSISNATFDANDTRYFNQADGTRGGDVTKGDAFRRWFDGSKTVDYDGKPKVLFHGAINTDGGFDSFNRVAGTYATQARSINAVGSWFTDSPGDASNFAGASERTGTVRDGGQVFPVYVAIKNPFRVSSYDSLVALWEAQAGGNERLQNGDPDKFRAVLMAQGYDGLVIEAQNADTYAEEGSQYWVAFHPEQIKSAIGNSGAFDPSSTSILNQNAEPFYSAALRAIEEAKGAPKKGDAKAWKGWLDGAVRRGEFKQAERDWLGLDAWLDANAPVTREQLANYVGANQIAVEDVVLGKPAPYRDPEAAIQFLAQHLDSTPEGIREGYGYSDEADYVTLANDMAAGKTGFADQVKFQGYQLPGGENYRELLLTLNRETRTYSGRVDVRVPDDADEGVTVDDYLDGLMTDLGAEGLEELDYGADRNEGALEFNGWTAADVERLRVFVKRAGLPDSAVVVATDNDAAGEGFRSSHFNQPNILAHVRFNERTDADGKRVLFLEEVQSDWHQKGRKEGYARGNKGEAFTRETDFGPSYGVRWPDGREQVGFTSLAVAQERANRGEPTGVPDAPFKGTDEWAMLAFRRMVRWAAENGFDRIAWTTGDQQAARYDLSKHIEAIHYSKNEDGTFNVVAVRSASESAAWNDDAASLDTIEQTLGKEIAEKINNGDGEQRGTKNPYKRLSGLDLKVGGEGMRGFYDSILPKAVNKWAKRFGGKVGKAKVRTHGPTARSEIRAGDVARDNGLSWEAFQRLPHAEQERMNREAHAKVRQEVDGAVFAEQHSLELTPAMREAALSGQPLFQPDGAGAPRGQIAISADGRMAITLFASADLSTFFHESAHFFLEVMEDLAEADGAPQQVRDDYAAIRKFLGVEPGERIEEAHHERFARSFELYLRTGKAPAPELVKPFARFRRWLTSLYREIEDLLRRGAKALNPEIIAVLDRMVAVDEEIELMSQRQGHVPLMAREEFAKLGLSDKAWESYVGMLEAATEEARAEVTAAVLKAHQGEQDAARAEERAAIRAELLEQLEQTQAVRAWRILSGRDVGQPVELHGLTLDRDALVESYKPAQLKELRGLNVYRKDGGRHQDTVAAVLGFDSGDALVTALLSIRAAQAAIPGLVDAEMQRRHPDPVEDGTLPDRVTAALYRSRRVAALEAELALLARLAGVPAPNARAMKAIAERVIAGKTPRTLRPNDYLSAERKAAREATKAAAAGDYAKALQFKREQTQQAVLYAEARRAKDRAEAQIAALRKAATPKTLERIGKAGKEYVDALEALLEGHELKAASAATVRRREALRAWVASMQEGLEATAVSDELLARVEAERVTNVADLTLEQLAELHEAVANLLHLARLKNTMLANADARTWEEAREALLNRMRQSLDQGKPPPFSDADLTMLGALGDQYGTLMDWVLQPETVVEWLDGGETGPWHDYLWNQAEGAQAKREELRRLVGDRLAKMMADVPAKQRRALDRLVEVKGLGRPISRHSIIGFALNLGNAQNRDKLMRGGFAVDGVAVPFTEELAAAMLSHLTRADLELVQGIWDAVELLWPHIVALQEELTGITPEKVEAQSITIQTVDGPVTLRGGYYPAVYDSFGSDAGTKQAKAQEDKLFGGSFTGAVTSKGHNIARTEFAAPMLLDYHKVLTRHLGDVITDLSHRVFVKQALRILNDGEIKGAIRQRLSSGAYFALLGSVRNAVVGGHTISEPASAPMEKLKQGVMTNTAVAALGFKVSLLLGNTVVAPIQALARVRPRHLAAGFGRYYRNPVEQTAIIHTLSPMMLARAEGHDVSYEEALASLRGKRGVRAKVVRVALACHRWIVPLAERFIWMGRYMQAQADGSDMAEAVRLADKAIRQTQTKHAPKDLSAAERDPRYKLLNLFIGPLVVMNNRLQDAGLRGKLHGKVESWPEALGTWLAVVAGGSWVFELLMGRGPDDDDDDGVVGADDWAAWLAWKAALFPLQTFPLLRNAANLFDPNGTGSARPDPVTDAMQALYRFGQAGKNWIEGEAEDEQIVTAATRAAGVAFGLPSGQLLITGRNLYDMLTGEHEPENAAEAAKLLLYKRDVDE